MCYHYTFTKKQEQVMKAITAEWEMPFEPVFHANGFTFPHMPVITSQEPGKVQAYTWGLIPHWVGTLEEATKLRAQTLNAKGETIFEKPAFRSYVPKRRCLVLADGFFEWMEFQKKKYPHLVRLQEEELFAFAGIYSHWTEPETGELFRTFAIITTAANPFMARIHNSKQRMPVILPRAAWQDWLNPELPREKIQELLQPCPDSYLKAHTIDRAIGRPGADTNHAGTLAEVSYPELGASPEQFSLFDS
ncbi:SOS response-associated peptidase [Flaviaesturariibacter flavus]|uniref:Abasic site processing protein n=1 Tax=Flaviaesturariibacter flavus TaxID=2502780 RepID=A0A4R1BB05_9BACT|nr:SOS response-associated peptidase [Flaviaesturariibacter flavus]TCJ14134.1 SOS response-associated peptidase [Flaviaesturariibacter flavus]